jgi:hypothetical protein
VRNRSLAVAAALIAALSGLLVALTPAPALAASGDQQAGPFPVGNLLSYANSDFEGQANFVPVTNIKKISDSSAAALHGKDSLEFTAKAAGTTALKLQEGSSPTQINVNPGGKSDTYTLGGWFKLPTANSGESVTFGLGLYDSSGTWINWFDTPSLPLSATSNWQYVEGQVTAPANAAWALDSPEITLSNAKRGQVAYLDMLVLKPYRGAQAIGAHGACSDPCNYSANNWTTTNNAIGPLQSDKEFFDPTNSPPDGNLPSSFKDTICYAIETKLGRTPADQLTWPVCIIAYKGTLSSNDATAQADMNSFLAAVPPQQELYIVWHSEPEGKSFSGQPGCGKDTSWQAFTCEFERLGTFVHESTHYGPNIFVAMDSAGSYYSTEPDGCNWMPANNNNSTGGADVYLVDFYEYKVVAGTNVNTEASRQQEWRNWLSCATAQSRPIGFGEYGLDESTPPPLAAPTCTNNKNDAAQAPNAMSADNSYLETLPMSGQAQMKNPVPVVMWDYWYSYYGGTPDCTVFTSPTAISTWMGIENANGGG